MFTEDLIPVASGPPPVELYLASTAGPPDRTLLVLHGGPDWDHSYLREPLDRLAGTHRLLMPDLRGCGRSTRGLPDDQYTPDAAVSDLVTLLERTTDATPVDVLGFSYGGLLAQLLALTAPDRVRRLIIASSSVLPPPPGGAGPRFPDDPALTGPALTRAAAFAGAEQDVWSADRRAEYRARLARVRFSAEWLRALRAGRLPSPRVPDAAHRLAALGTPLLLLHGAHDRTFPAGLVADTLPLIPGARGVVLPRAAHMAHIDQPEPWLAAVAQFLESS